MKTLILFLFALIASAQIIAQPTNDTLQFNFGESSNMVINLNDLSDYEVLQSYNLDSLVDRMSHQLKVQETEVEIIEEVDEKEDRNGISIYLWDDEIIRIHDSNQEGKENVKKVRKYPYFRTNMEMDIGMNNYISDGAINSDNDDSHTVRNWGSWYVGINSTLNSYLSKTFSIKSGLGVSWYNFKFQNDDTSLIESDGMAQFVLDESGRNNTKSKLTVAYLNASVVPMFRLTKKSRVVLGIGGYAGYRIDSYTKSVFRDSDGDKEKERLRDNYYLNDWRYGVRLQFAVKGREMFVNYDLNSLFQDNRGPKLNAISFGFVI